MSKENDTHPLQLDVARADWLYLQEAVMKRGFLKKQMEFLFAHLALTAKQHQIPKAYDCANSDKLTQIVRGIRFPVFDRSGGQPDDRCRANTP